MHNGISCELLYIYLIYIHSKKNVSDTSLKTSILKVTFSLGVCFLIRRIKKETVLGISTSSVLVLGVQLIYLLENFT